MAGIEDYSTTPGSNTSINGISIAEGMPPSNVNDAFRQMMADVRRENSITSLTSSVTISIGEAAGGRIHIITDANKSISAFDTVAAGIERTLIFDVAATLVHDSTKMKLPGLASVSVSAGDTIQMLSEGSGNWRALGYPSTSVVTVAGTQTLTNKTLTSPTLTTPALGTPASGVLTNCTGLPQAGLKTTTGEVSVSNSDANATLPGGTYGFYPQIRTNASATVLFHVGNDPGTSYVTNIRIDAAGTGAIGLSQQRYVQSSPPYNLGNGDVPLFVFLRMVGGEIVQTYVAQDPPWAYNGPTDTRADYYRDGKGYQRPRLTAQQRMDLLDPAKRDAVLEQLATASDVEVTQAIKNADMPLIPHPFLQNDLVGSSIVLLDPVGAMAEQLAALHLGGESVSDLLYGKYLTIDNTPLSCGTPAGVVACRTAWK